MLYPILTSSRIMEDLSGTWNFKFGTDELYTGKLDKSFFTKGAETMPVPASYNDIKEGYKYRYHYGWVYYERNISVPSFLKDQRIVLRMESVTHKAKVYINGELVTEHKGGFLPFEAEINDFVKPGDNSLVIAVDNIIDFTTLPTGGSDMMGGGMGPDSEALNAKAKKKKKNMPNFDFFNYAGIHRPVKIYTTPKSYIDDITLTNEVNFEDSSAVINYNVKTVNGDGEKVCKVTVKDEKGETVAESCGTDGKLLIEKANLWWPGNAYLYNVEVSYGDDIYTLPYGIRTVRLDGLKFLINEKPFYFKGYGKHEDTFPHGKGENLPMNAKDISLMKWQNANSFRTSHYPYSEEMMRLCDREGIVVIDETPAVGINLSFGGGANFHGKRIETFDKEHGIKTFDHHCEVIRDLIARDKNYACVVMWSIANEPESTAEGAYEYFEPLYKLAKELDPETRPCTMASVQAANPMADCSTKLSDVICLNRYYGWYIAGGDLEASEIMLRNELKEWESIGKPLMFTEYGTDTVLGIHDTTPTMFTEEYQVEYYKMYSKVFDEFNFVMGEQLWNFADFMTDQGIVRVQGNKKGIFTRERKPKLAAHYFRMRWENIPDFGYKG